MVEILLLFFLGSAQAQEFFTVKNGSKLELFTDCIYGAQHVEALREWSRSTGGPVTCAPMSMPGPRNRECKYDITACTPSAVKKLINTRSKRHGPNCFNAALVGNNQLDSVRYVGNKEMTNFLKSKLCRALQPGEARSPGDFGAIVRLQFKDDDKRKTNPKRGEDPLGVGLEHVFTHVNDHMVYSKNGFAQKAPHALEPPDGMLRRYEVPEDDKCRKNNLAASEDCSVATQYFRCTSWSAYMAKLRAVPVALRRIFLDVEKYEKAMENYTLKGGEVPSEEKKKFNTSLSQLREYLTSERADKFFYSRLPADDQKFLVHTLCSRVDSFYDQKFDNSYGEYEDEDMKYFNDAIKQTVPSR